MRERRYFTKMTNCNEKGINVNNVPGEANSCNYTELENSRAVGSSNRRQSHRSITRTALLLTGLAVFGLAFLSAVSNTTLNSSIIKDGGNVDRFLVTEGDDWSSYSCSDLYANTFNSTLDEQCAYAQQCDGDGISFAFVFCSKRLSAVKYSLLISPLVLIWLVTLFRVLGSTAEDYFSPALEMLSWKFGLPPRFAGVSLLALGNGAADVSSTMSAISSDPNHGYLLSLGALTGSGMFISTVVAGVVIVSAEGDIPCRGALVRDVVVFMTAVSLVYISFKTGSIGPTQIYAWLGLYFSFLITVLAADIYHRRVVLPQLMEQQLLRDQQLQQKMIQMNDAESPDAAEMELAPMEGDKKGSFIRISTRSIRDMAEVIEEKVPIMRYSRFGKLLDSLSNYNYNEKTTGSQGWVAENNADRPMLFHAKYGLLKHGSNSSESDDKEGMHAHALPSPKNSDHHGSSISYQPMVDNDGDIDEASLHEEGIRAQSWIQAFTDGKEEFVTHWCEFWGDIYYNEENNVIDKFLLTCEMPFSIMRQLTVPVPCDGYYCRPLVAISVALSTLWVGLYYYLCYTENIFFPQILVAFPISAAIGLCVLRYAPYGEKNLSLALAVPVSLYGFVIAATWINWIADRLVGVLGFLGVVCHIPGSVMGMTILAWGNSISDLVADVSMAKKGLANMAITACYAGPIFVSPFAQIGG